jgi:xylose dehydrogenase (NAD/NADP)
MHERVGIGFLGTAQISRNKHLPAIRASRNARVVAVASRDLQRAQAFAADCGIERAFGRYEDLLADPDVDVILNALPNSLHHEWTIRAAEAGKHILCEKPLAVSESEAREMFAAAKANNVRLMEAFTHRFQPALAYAKQQLDAGVIGRPVLIKSELMFELKNWNTDVRANASLAGGSLLDAGCYCISTLLHLMGREPSAVRAVQTLRQPQNVDSTFLGTLEFAGGTLACFCSSMEARFRSTLEIVGSAGAIEIPALFNGDLVRVHTPAGLTEQTFTPPDRFLMQIEHFCDRTRNTQPLLVSEEDSLHLMRTLDRLRQAVAPSRNT